VESEKLKSEELMSRTSVEKSSVDRCDDENCELREHVQTLQTQLGQLENEHVQRSITLKPVTHICHSNLWSRYNLYVVGQHGVLLEVEW